ncbi:hypothetical protein EE612_046276, partial [Oryza sativa]
DGELWVIVKDVDVQLLQYHKTSSLTFAIEDGPQASQTVPHVHIHIIPERKEILRKMVKYMVRSMSKKEN